LPDKPSFFSVVTVLSNRNTERLGIAGSTGIVLGHAQETGAHVYAVLITDETFALKAPDIWPTGEIAPREAVYPGESLRVAPERYGVTRIEVGRAAVILHLGVGDDPATVGNVDVEVILDDGSRWGATLLTIAEIERLMARWRLSGEAQGGAYFQCRDLVVIRDPGTEAIVELIGAMITADEIRSAFVELDRAAPDS